MSYTLSSKSLSGRSIIQVKQSLAPLADDKSSFIPFFQERDHLGRLITS